MNAPPWDALAALPLQCAEHADQLFHRLQALAHARGVVLRAPPPHPSSCCGRGCHGCVWEGFLAAAAFWRDDAIDALKSCTP